MVRSKGPTPMQPTDTASAAHGLEGVVVADTEMSAIDGDAGRLVIRGHDVEALARAADFEGVCGLLWNGELPSADAAAAFRAELGAARVRAHPSNFSDFPCWKEPQHLAIRKSFNKTIRLAYKSNRESVRHTPTRPVAFVRWIS